MEWMDARDVVMWSDTYIYSLYNDPLIIYIYIVYIETVSFIPFPVPICMIILECF